MSPKCPNCGYEPPKGRPKKLDDKRIRAVRNEGASLSEIARAFEVTRGAIQASLKRTARKKVRARRDSKV